MDGSISFDFTAATLTNSTASISRKTAFALARPPTERIKACIAFLHQIQRISVLDTVKDGNGDSCLLLDVCILDDDAGATAKGALGGDDASAGAEVTHLQIQRTFKEFQQLEKVVHHWSGKHVGPLSAQYGVGECTYCASFYAHETRSLWPGTFEKLTTSKRKLEKQLEVCINVYVRRARLPRPSALECQGFDHIPSIVTRFLLEEVPVLVK